MARRRFHWSTVFDCVMHETDENGDTLVQYTHEPGQFGPLLSENRDGAESYHHYDALGSTTLLTNDAGTVTDTFQFDAWGNQIARTGTTETPYTWVGRWGYQDDSATSSGYYIRARSYQPAVARWMSVDLLYETIFYTYVFNAPAQQIDRTGNLGERLVGTPKAGPCAAYEVVTQWILGPSEETGFIVQHVTVEENVADCGPAPSNRCTKDLGPINSGDPCQDMTMGYFEYWNVVGGKFPRQKPGQPLAMSDKDIFAHFGYDQRTSGSHTKYGAAVFIPKQGLTDADHRALAKFKQGRGGVPEAGILKSVCWNDDVNKLFRKYYGGLMQPNRVNKNATITWNCCCNCPPSVSDFRVEYNIQNVVTGPLTIGLSFLESEVNGTANSCTDC